MTKEQVIETCQEMMDKVFTVKEYVPDYMCMKSYYITYNLNDMTITVDGRSKKMNEYRYKKALEYLKNNVSKQALKEN